MSEREPSSAAWAAADECMDRPPFRLQDRSDAMQRHIALALDAFAAQPRAPVDEDILQAALDSGATAFLQSGNDLAAAMRAALAAMLPPPEREALRIAREAIDNYLSANYDHPRAHRPGKCKHGIFYYATCEICIDVHFEDTLTRIRALLGETET